jgi:transcription-repair coupling factor (superfamily II helicase)
MQAYAYLLVPADGGLDETAQRRLRVIEELTELGAGFKLALRDLEIRGAGNLLGAQQHGHIAAVGFDLYTKLLEEAVRELRGAAPAAEVDPTVTVEVEALLPEAYVPEESQRLALYQRLGGRSWPIDSGRRLPRWRRCWTSWACAWPPARSERSASRPRGAGRS